MRFGYDGMGKSKFDPTDVACDSKRRIIVSDCVNISLRLLSPYGTFLKYLLSHSFDKPYTIALFENNLWIGFCDGTVTVYKYTD